jgi:hypothetical protein
MVAVLGVGAAFALPSGTYVTGVSCVNLTDTAANITVQAYSPSAALSAFDDTIAAGSNVQYFTGTTGDDLGTAMGTATVGSAVVESDQNIACSVNTQTTGGTLRVGTSNGIPGANTASTIYVPQALRLTSIPFYSYVAVQNAGDASVGVTATFYDANGDPVDTDTATIPAGSSHIFDQAGNDTLGTSFNGSVTISSDDNNTPLAGTVVLYDGSTTLLTYDAFASGSTEVIGPRFVKNISNVALYSGLACQNLGTVSTTITADFAILNQADNTTVTGQTSKLVEPSQSYLLHASSFGNAALDAISRGYGSVTISSDEPVACTFNENATSGTFQGNGSTYNGLPAANATTTLAVPQVVDLGASSYRGGFQYANTTGTATTCTHTYATKADGVLGTVPNIPLAANGSNSVFAATEMAASTDSDISGKAGAFNGSVTVECGQAIVGIYNLANTTVTANGAGDSFTTNTGVNTD